MAINKGEKIVSRNRNLNVPTHLKNAPNNFMKKLGNSDGYKYPHDYKKHFVEMQYLPKEISHERFYYPSKLGIEKRIHERLNKIWKNKYKKDIN